MNVWDYTSFVQILALLPCAYLCFFKQNAVDRLIGLEMAGVIETLLLVAMAQREGRPGFYDIALTLSILTFGSGMVFIRFMERWL